MITNEDAIALLNGKNQADPAFYLDPTTKQLKFDASKNTNEPGRMVTLPNGQTISADRYQYLKQNEEEYNKQILSLMHEVSPYFKDSYTSGIIGTVARPVVGLAEGLSQAAGSAVQSVADMPSAIARNLEEENWNNFKKTLSKNKALELSNLINHAGGRGLFALTTDIKSFVKKAAEERQLILEDEDYDALERYHKLLQRKIADEQNMDVFKNYNAAFQGKLSSWSPNMNSTFQQLSKPIGNVVGSLATNVGLAMVPYVGQVAAYGLAFNQQYYAKRIQALEKGWSLDKANAWALVYGGAETAIESLTIKGATRALLSSSKSLRNAAFNFVLPEGFEEMGQTITEAFIDNATGLDVKTMTDIALEAGFSFVLGAIGGGIVGGIDFTGGQISSRLEALQVEEEKLADDQKLLPYDYKLERGKFKPITDTTRLLPQEAGKEPASITRRREELKKIEQKKQQLYSKLESLVREKALKANPKMTQEQLDTFVKRVFKMVESPNFQGSVVGTVYNSADQLIKRSNWQNDEAKANIEMFSLLFNKASDNKDLRVKVNKSLEKLLDSEKYAKFKDAMSEVSVLIRKDLMSAGATEEQADMLANLYEGLFFETALKSDKLPSEIYESMRPTMLNMNRARLNGQQGLTNSILDGVNKQDRPLDISTAAIDARQAVLDLQRAVGSNNTESRDRANNIIYGANTKAPSSLNTLNALVNQALAQQKIHEEMGVLENLKEEEWISFALLKEIGYSESELLNFYGVKMQNAETAYNDALQKTFPALNGDEIAKLESVRKNLLSSTNKRESTSGVYSTQDNAIFVGTDAPLATHFHEVSHALIYNTLLQAKKRQDMGVDFNTAADKLVRTINKITKNKFGEYPNERQFQETAADMLSDYYIRNKAESKETASEIYNAVYESETQDISNAESLYGELDEKEKSELMDTVEQIEKYSEHRNYVKNANKAAEIENTMLSKEPDDLLNEIIGILNDSKNPLRGSTSLKLQASFLAKNKPENPVAVYDLGYQLASALRRTAAEQYVNEQLKEEKAPFAVQQGQLDVFKGFHSGYAVFDSDFMDNIETPFGERLALSEKYIKDCWEQLNMVPVIMQSKMFLKNLMFSPYKHANDFSPALGRVAREAYYEMGKTQQKYYNVVTKVQKRFRDGCKKNKITNNMYWDQFVGNYLQGTKEGHEAAVAFAERILGEEGVSLMEELDAMFSEFSDMLAAAGLDIGKVEFFAPRRIKDYEAFKVHLKRNPKHPLYKIINEMRSKGASENEINNFINSAFYNKPTWEKGKVTGFQKRKVMRIRKEDLKFYHDPFDAMIKYIDDTARTIAMRKLFGYAQENLLSEKVDYDKVREDTYNEFLEGEVMESLEYIFKKVDNIKNRKEALDFINKQFNISKDRFVKLYCENDSFEGLMAGIYDGWLANEIEARKKEQVMIDSAKSKTDKFISEYKKVKEDFDQNYGSAGKLIKQMLDSGEKDADEVRAVIEALKSLSERNGGNVRLLDGLRVLNTLTVIGSKFTSTVANLKELSLCAWRFGVLDTLRAVRVAHKNGDEFLREIGIPSLNEVFKRQDDVIMQRFLDFAFKVTGFTKFDSITKSTIAFSAMNNAVKVLKKADIESKEYHRLQNLLNRTFAFDPKYDLDGSMAKRRLQVEEDIKNNNMTEDVKFFLFNVISDQQPINSLEVPVGYNNAGSLGKLCYQFSTVQLKQFEFLYNEMKRVALDKKENKFSFIGRLLSFMACAALFGVPTEWIRQFITGRKLSPLHTTAFMAIGDFVMLNSYFFMQAKREGLPAAIFRQYTPQLALFTDMSKDITKNIFGKGKFSDMRTFRHTPVIGELWWFWFGGGRSYSVGSDLAWDFEEESPLEDALPTIKFLGSF